ncbi:MAG: efflux RND transporter permease subunit, partial [Candidatus Omnitrophica bacterium]|nr:efflux RND transporter permease subunit [Candidatus Omnitrophota bacterium]
MIEFFVRRPITTIMFILVFVVLGMTSYSNLNVEENPQVDFPMITVSAVYPGATPLEVEIQVVNKIEDAVSELAGIKKIKSQSFDSLGYVFIEFNLEEDVNVKFIEVKDKVEAILNDLPKDMDKPIIEKYDPLMLPVAEIVLYSDTKDTRDIYEYVDKIFKDHITAINGVANVDIYGGKEKEINVKVDPILMKQHYITIDNVINTIARENKNIPGGSLEKSGDSLSLRVIGEFRDLDDIKNLLIISQDGERVKLNDIAEVIDGYKQVDTIARFNGREVVGLSVNKVSDGNAINIVKELKEKFPKIKAIMPKDISVEIASETTTFIVNETIDTQWSILFGILLTVIVLYFFTGNSKVTFIAAIVLPSSIVSTFFLMDMAGFTINTMTLIAIATSLGTLIANAIVIVENVLVHIKMGKDSDVAAIDGTKEVITAVLAATGTNLVVFTPIAFMGGIIGQFMKSFGLTVVFATIFSLIASLSLTPMLCGLLFHKNDNDNAGKKQKKENGISIFFHGIFKKIESFEDKTIREYSNIFKFITHYKGITLIIIFLLLYSMKFILPYIGGEFYPPYDTDKIYIDIVMPQGSLIDRTDETVSEIEKELKNIPEIRSYLSNIGEDGVENAMITIDLISYTKRAKTDMQIIDELIPFLAGIAEAEINVRRGGGHGNKRGDISVDVYGIDYDKMIELSTQMKKVMKDTGMFRFVDSSYKYPKNEIQFLPDQEKTTEYGVNNAQAGFIVRSAVYGNDDNIYKEAGEEYDIEVEFTEQYREDIEDIKQIDVMTRRGLVPIYELGNIYVEKAFPTITHRDKKRAIRLEGYLGKNTANEGMAKLDELFKEKIKFENGYSYRYVESAEYSEDSSKELGTAFLLAIILTFMLLAAIMNSTLYPIAIVFSVATSFTGVFLFMFFFRCSVNIASMLSMVMLVGLVVNNSILMLEHTMDKMKEGKST